MPIFVDTSALYASLSSTDKYHPDAKTVWDMLVDKRQKPVTTNYVLLETMALVGRRLGLQAVREFQTQLIPVLQVSWVDEQTHERAISALLTAGERALSLVDCVSFEIMRHHGIDTAFTFDSHFASQVRPRRPKDSGYGRPKEPAIDAWLSSQRLRDPKIARRARTSWG